MTSSPIEFVPLGDTIADIALKEANSVALAETTSILLVALVVTSFTLNVLLIASVLSSYKLRNCTLYLFLCCAAFINILDTVFIMFLSLLHFANADFTFGDDVCRINAFFQQLVFLQMLFLLLVMAAERCINMLLKWEGIIKRAYLFAFTISLMLIATGFSIPIFFNGFPVQSYRFRYLCSIGKNSMLLYNVVEIIVYVGTLLIILACFSALIRKGSISRQLPVMPQDYECFITETRAIQEHMQLGRIVIYLTIAYVVLQGPYIIMSFVVQIKNSDYFYDPNIDEFELPQDADTMITWLRFFHPLIVPLIVFMCCHDVWAKMVNLVCCRRSTPGGVVGVWSSDSEMKTYGTTANTTNNVLTLVATSNGLELHVPEGNRLYDKKMAWKNETLNEKSMAVIREHASPPVIQEVVTQSKKPLKSKAAKKSNMYGNVEHVFYTPVQELKKGNNSGTKKASANRKQIR